MFLFFLESFHTFMALCIAVVILNWSMGYEKHGAIFMLSMLLSPIAIGIFIVLRGRSSYNPYHEAKRAVRMEVLKSINNYDKRHANAIKSAEKKEALEEQYYEDSLNNGETIINRNLNN